MSLMNIPVTTPWLALTVGELIPKAVAGKAGVYKLLIGLRTLSSLNNLLTDCFLLMLFFYILSSFPSFFENYLFLFIYI